MTCISKQRRRRLDTNPKEEQTEEEDDTSVFGTKNKVEQGTG